VDYQKSGRTIFTFIVPLTKGNNDVILNGEDYGTDEYVLMPRVTDFNAPQWWRETAPPDSQGSVMVSQSGEISLYSGGL